MELKEDYKQTEVGLIPSDWGVYPITKLTNEIFLGLTSKVDYVESGGIPLIRATDIATGRLSFEKARTISVTQHKALTKYRKARSNNVLVSKSGSLGVCALVDVDKEFSIYESIIVLQPKKILNSVFLLWLMRDERTQIRMIGEKVGSSVAHLNIEMFRKLTIQLPPASEQSAIANALSDADALIQSLTSLITKKRQIKQGAIQSLLSPYENGCLKVGWVEMKLGGIVKALKGSGLSKGKLSSSGRFQCLLYGELFTTYKEVINAVESKTNSSEGILSVMGDILLPGSTTTTGIDLATASALMVDDVQLGGDVIVLRKKDNSCHPSFLAHYLSHIKKYEIAQLTKGITIHHLYGSDLIDIEVSFPSFEEQNKISTILSDIDTEIAALETKLVKIQQIKQGMMQNLLTGRIRLVKN